MVFQLAYSSTAARPLRPAALRELLVQSRRANDRRDVTGVLLHRDGRFLQLLEGEERTVRDLYALITADARHTGVGLLAEGRRLRRQFTGWTMAFRDLVEEPIAEPGYTSLFEDAVERVESAVDELVPRLRPSGPAGRPVVLLSRVLGQHAG